VLEICVICVCDDISNTLLCCILLPFPRLLDPPPFSLQWALHAFLLNLQLEPKDSLKHEKYVVQSGMSDVLEENGKRIIIEIHNW
jgi:hypothetical protein